MPRQAFTPSRHLPNVYRPPGRALILCGAMEQSSKLLSGPRFLERVGPENIMPNIQAALDRAAEVYAQQADTAIVL